MGLFLSHGGWNSVTYGIAAARGVPLRPARERGGGGVGAWKEQWSWDGEDGLVSGREIGETVKELMEDAMVRERAARVGREAAMPVAEGGSTSYRSLQEFVAKLEAS
jgi:hypothetical protein